MRTLLRAVAAPRSTRAAYWNEVVTGTIGGLDLRLDEGPDLRDELLIGSVGPLRVAVSRSGPGQATRTAAHIRAHDPQSFVLFAQAEGVTVSEQDGRCARFAPGDIGLSDLSRPLRCTYSERRVILLSYPKAMSPLPEHRVMDLTGVSIPGSDGAAALVSGLIQQLPNHLDADDGARGARIGSAILDLVAVSLAARLDQLRTVPSETRSRALLHRCRAFIETHLADPALTPALVATTHHISLRYLHRLFEPTGESVAALIRSRRLDRCRRDLLDPVLADRPVAAIGARWGFTSAAHFNRAFKLRFALPPAEYRSMHAARVDNDLAL